jgi:hypothetical protein
LKDARCLAKEIATARRGWRQTSIKRGDYTWLMQ